MKHPRPAFLFSRQTLQNRPAKGASPEGRLPWDGNPVTDANG